MQMEGTLFSYLAQKAKICKTDVAKCNYIITYSIAQNKLTTGT